MQGGRLSVSVVLPTYNESESLPVVIPRISAALNEAGIAGEIIVVDDDSPDRTADVARELSHTYPVRVLHRTRERGLGTAVVAGFRMSEAEVCVVMDADGSHPVEALANMVRLIQEDKAEIVVGSRHVEGGGSEDWPLFSQLKSRFAASLAVGLTTMTDPTTGFMAIRRSLFQKLELDPVGWKIVLETVVKAHPARLAEVPIVFTDREHGESKQSFAVLSQYLQHLYKLYKHRFPAVIELLKFCLVGFLGVFVDLSVVSALKVYAGMDTRLCQVFGFSAAVSFNYAINRRFSFERARETPLLFSYVAYVGANLVGLSLRILAIQALITVTALDQGRGYLLLSAFGIALATLVNFVGVKYFAFAPERLWTQSEEDGAPERKPAPASRIATIAVSFVAVLVLASSFVMGDKALTHDEQVNLVMAENIRANRSGLVHPSVTPGLVSNWREQALPELGNTPVYPLALSLFIGPAPARGLLPLSLVLTFGLLLFGVYRALARVDRSAAHVAVMLLASAPFVLAQYALYEFEPLVCSLGAVGFAALTYARGSRAVAYGALAGAALGLGFAVKMWLIVPALFACVAYQVSRTYITVPRERSGLRRASAALVIAFVIAASSHLVFVALTAPQDLAAWLEWVYLGIFSGQGVTGPKLSGEGAMHGAREPAFAYLGWLLRDHGALLVPFVLGLPAATRRLGEERRAYFAAALGALFGLVPLSVPAIKEPLYMAAVLPMIYAGVALALVAPDRAPPRYVRVNESAARVSLAIAIILASGLCLHALVTSGESRGLLLSFRLVHLAIWSVPSVLTLRKRPVTPALSACAIASATVSVLALFLLPRGLF